MMKYPHLFFFNGLCTTVLQEDFPACDLLIVMGTSLKVQPFASLIDDVPETTPRLLINREKSGGDQESSFLTMMFGGGMKFDSKDNYRCVRTKDTYK